MNVIVIGGGIVGLSSAWALEASGHRVTLLEQGDLPNFSNASTNPHRLIRYPYGDLDGYARLVGPAFDAWDRLWSDLGRSYFVETGTLAISRAPNDWAERSQRGLERLGIAHRVLRPDQLCDVHAALSSEGVRSAVQLETGGVLLSDRIAIALVEHLERHGVELRPRTKVLEIDSSRHTVRLEDGEVMNADALVIAVGAYVKRLLPELGAELRTNRKVNLYLQPPAALSGVWSNAPIVVDLGGDSAGVLIPPVAGTPIRFGLGQADRSVEVEHEVEVSALEAGQMLEFLEQSVLDFAGYRFVGSLSCHHVSSSDERFVLRGIAERTWVVSGCSGHMYKFGPLIGESMAAALGDSSGERDLLESFTNLGNAMQPA